MRTNEAITNEIETLKKMKPTVRRESAFGDNHHNSIDAQVRVLENRWTSEETEDRYESAPDNVRDSALQAAYWLHEDSDDLPSADWESLVQ